jgi:hypothetical protein
MYIERRHTMRQYDFEYKSYDEGSGVNAFGMNTEEIASLYDELANSILPEIQENEKLMALSYESMMSDKTPLI